MGERIMLLLQDEGRQRNQFGRPLFRNKQHRPFAISPTVLQLCEFYRLRTLKKHQRVIELLYLSIVADGNGKPRVFLLPTGHFDNVYNMLKANIEEEVTSHIQNYYLLQVHYQKKRRYLLLWPYTCYKLKLLNNRYHKRRAGQSVCKNRKFWTIKCQENQVNV